VQGYCLDVGCGKHNRFINEFVGGNGKGIDVYRYEGLTDEQLVEDIPHFPFEDETFDMVCFIVNINHAPKSLRDIELGDAIPPSARGKAIYVDQRIPQEN